MESCLGCKFIGKRADNVRNWCSEPTFPKGMLVTTNGHCSNWVKSKAKLEVEFTPIKTDKQVRTEKALNKPTSNAIKKQIKSNRKKKLDIPIEELRKWFEEK